MTDATQDNGGVSTPVPPQLRAAVRWYLLGFTLLGGAMGFFAGMSQTPVIGTLLPLLFGLVGGAGGLYVTQADLAKPETWVRLRVLGKVLACFIVFAVVGSLYGASLRTGRSLWNLFSAGIFLPERVVNLAASGQDDPRKAIQLVMLRSRIRTLGASPEEERFILERAAQSLAPDKMPDPVASLRRLAVLATKTTVAVTSAVATDRSSGRDARSAALELRAYLGLYAEDYSQCTDRMTKGEKVPTSFVRYRIDGLRSQIEKSLTGYDAALWLSQHDAARQAIWELQWALIDEWEKLGAAEWLQGGSLVDQIDRFLAMFYSGGKKGGEETPPWKLPELSYRR